ncbi:MAG: methylmalonyl Co-A mutase-associated GTPase MeaB, partial [Chloroflexota bacterium]
MGLNAQQVLSGNRRVLAKLLTHVENENPAIQPVLDELFQHTGQAHVIGITGSPGTGKSTLVSALVSAYRQREQTVAVVAVDPTSPFSGGAVLGDRIRMSEHAGDRGVFIRSMATRGNPGGLSRAAQQATWVLDAAGYDIVLVETVGAGQSEVDIVRAAHTTLVLEAPGLGDGVQSIKGGILEIADVLVVNKADRPGAINTVRTLKAMLELGHPTKITYSGHHRPLEAEAPVDAPRHDMWIPPVIETVATDQKGLDELLEAIKNHRKYLATVQHGSTHSDELLIALFHRQLQQTLLARFLDAVPEDAINELILQI